MQFNCGETRRKERAEMVKTYVYEHEEYEDTAEGRRNLALAIVREEPYVYDELDFERWVDSHESASGVLWQVKEYGYDDTIIDLVSQFEEWYAEENTVEILDGYSESYDTRDDEAEEDEEEEE